MPLKSRLRSNLIETRATLRVMRHLPVLLPGARGSAARLLERNALRHPERTAVLFEDRRYTWADYHRRASRYARFFASRGVGPGDAVAVLMDNRPEYLFALLGLSQIHGVAACINTHVSGAALAHAVRLGKPRLALVGVEHRERFSEAFAPGDAPPLCLLSDGDRASTDTVDGSIDAESERPLRSDAPKNTDPAMFLYTSGTTGLPKAAVVTNQRFLAASFVFGHVLHDATADDVVYCCLPLYHGSAQWGGMGASLATGAALALRRRFSASHFWGDVVKYAATRCLYIGELCRYLLLQPESPEERRHGLRSMTGNGLRKDVWVPFQERFRVPMIREFYGATEGNAPLANLEGRPGMIGRLGSGQALLRCDLETGAVVRDAHGRGQRIDDPGETGLFAGRITRLRRFDGYVDTQATESKILRDVFRRGDAWFNSGDLMTLHEDGWLSFADRVGDTFRWKGENVSTNEVAEALNRASGVLESIVYGVSVPGTEGRAGMASLRISEPFDLDAFGNHVVAALPSYARPLFLRLQRELRTTSTFKHQRVDYRGEGFDPARIEDPLYAFVGDRYVPIDRDLYDKILRGEIVPGAARAPESKTG